MTLILRIKKMYFVEIMDGSKTIEYRSMNKFNQSRLEGKTFETVIFHYQRPTRIRAEIVKIKKIKRPKFLKNSDIEFTDMVYAIHLKNPQLFEESA